MKKVSLAILLVIFLSAPGLSQMSVYSMRLWGQWTERPQSPTTNMNAYGCAGKNDGGIGCLKFDHAVWLQAVTMESTLKGPGELAIGIIVQRPDGGKVFIVCDHHWAATADGMSNVITQQIPGEGMFIPAGSSAWYYVSGTMAGDPLKRVSAEAWALLWVRDAN